MADKKDAYKAEVAKAKNLVIKKIEEISCGPIFIRTAWHDSGTFDKAHGQGGAIGSIRFEKEINAAPNAGLAKALNYLEPIKKECPGITWADLIQLASAESVNSMGGPNVPMKYGRKDANAVPEVSEAPFGLPDALPPFGGPADCAKDPAKHLRHVFYKYGFNDQEIVALSGAHTVGRAFKDRSGAVEYGYMKPSEHTARGCPFAGNSQTAGGQSWTKEWLKFDNSYFTQMETDKECVIFPTDKILMVDEGFKPTFLKYKEDQAAFFADYAQAHKKLSELGAMWDEQVAFDASEAELLRAKM